MTAPLLTGSRLMIMMIMFGTLPASTDSACTEEFRKYYGYKVDSYEKVPLTNMASRKDVVFSVKSCSAFLLGLAQTDSTYTQNYQVVIGGYSNRKSMIRDCDPGPSGSSCTELTTLDYHYPLDCYNFKPFWISWDVTTSTISVGTGSDVGVDQFMDVQVGGSLNNVNTLLIGSFSNDVEVVFYDCTATTPVQTTKVTTPETTTEITLVTTTQATTTTTATPETTTESTTVTNPETPTEFTTVSESATLHIPSETTETTTVTTPQTSTEFTTVSEPAALHTTHETTGNTTDTPSQSTTTAATQEAVTSTTTSATTVDDVTGSPPNADSTTGISFEPSTESQPGNPGTSNDGKGGGTTPASPVFPTTAKYKKPEKVKLTREQKKCRCALSRTNSTQTPEEKEREKSDAAAKIVKDLTVPTTNMSSTVRRKTCAQDSRPTATTVGSVGAFLCLLPVIFIIYLDVLGVGMRLLEKRKLHRA